VQFVTKVSLYFWNLRKILRLLIPMKSILWIKQNLDPYIVCTWPKKSWPMMKQSLGQTNFFATNIFGTFGRYVTNLRGAFVVNVKKSPKSTHPTGYISRHPSHGRRGLMVLLQYNIYGLWDLWATGDQNAVDVCS
jgi:hypothetical protein